MFSTKKFTGNKTYIDLKKHRYTQYGPIKNGRIKNQGSDFERELAPPVTPSLRQGYVHLPEMAALVVPGVTQAPIMSDRSVI